MAEKITIISDIVDLKRWVQDRSNDAFTVGELNTICDAINMESPPYGTDWQAHLDTLPEDLAELIWGEN